MRRLPRQRLTARVNKCGRLELFPQPAIAPVPVNVRSACAAIEKGMPVRSRRRRAAVAGPVAQAGVEAVGAKVGDSRSNS